MLAAEWNARVLLTLLASLRTPNPDEIVSEVSLIHDEAPEADLLEKNVEMADGSITSADAKETIKAMLDLKAYCVQASKGSFYEGFTDKEKNPVLAFIQAFSAPAPEDDIGKPS